MIRPAVAIFVLLSACKTDAATPAGPREPTVRLLNAAGESRLTVEVAQTPSERRRGLMFRKELAKDRGMIFVFPVEEEHAFWMKNTYVPLDMIFVDSQKKVVGVVPDAEPLTESSRTVEKPSLYVIEVPAGYAAQHSVTAGTVMQLDGVPEHTTD